MLIREMRQTKVAVKRMARRIVLEELDHESSGENAIVLTVKWDFQTWIDFREPLMERDTLISGKSPELTRCSCHIGHCVCDGG